MKRLTLILTMLTASMLGGCMTDEHQDLKQWMQEAGKDVKGRIPPLPEIKPFPVVSYETMDLVDPFSAVKIVSERKSAGSGALKPDMNRNKEPLEAFPLESLAMVGVLVEKGRMSAIIQADKAVYTVRPGNYLGQNFGKIIGITDTEVRIRELVQEVDEEWTERDASLQLQEQETKK